MSNTVRLIIGLVMIAASAALATPEVSSKLPPYVAAGLVAAVAAVLHKMDAQA